MNKPSLFAARTYLDALDLSYILDKMCGVNYPLARWCPELAQVCEGLYKRFLWLHVKFPGKHLVPTHEIDEFWHNHILHTQSYTKDCLHLFGHYLHHQPATEHDAAGLIQAFEQTKQLYYQEFGEALKVLTQAA